MLDFLAAVFPQVLGISLTTGLVIATLLLATPALAGRVKARWRCLVWGVLALRLLVPLQFSLPAAPVEVTLSQPAVVQNQPQAAPEGGGETAPPAQPETVAPAPSAEATPASPSASALNGLEVAALIWAAGGVAFLLWQGGRYLRFRKTLLRYAQPLREEEALQEAAQALGLARAIPLVVSPAAPAPMTLGLLHPMVVLPPQGYRREELACILRHELAHWQGRHLWCKFLFLLARGVHWFNPLVHLMARRGETDLELACDDRALAGAGPGERGAYARTILAAMAARPAPAACLTTQLQGGKTIMKARFHNILRPVGTRRGKLLPVAALAAALLLGSLVSCTGEAKADADVLTLPAEGTYSGAVLGVTTVEGQPAVLQKEAALGNAFTLYVPEGDGQYQFTPYTGELEPLRPGDVVLVTGTLGEEVQVWVVGMDVPALQGTLPAEAVSTAAADLVGANQASLPEDTPIYDTPDGAQTGTLGPVLAAVTSREGEWAQITPPGGDNPCWVRASDLDYAHFAQSLDTLDLARYLAPAGEASAAPGAAASEPAATPSAMDYTVTPGEDGTYTVTVDGVQVGGSAWIPYPGADQLDGAVYFAINSTAEDREPVEQLLRAMWAQRLGPGAEPDHIASNSDVADIEDAIVTGQGGENHFLFMDGDRVYDAWFQEGALTGQQMLAVLDSALPAHLG